MKSLADYPPKDSPDWAPPNQTGPGHGTMLLAFLIPIVGLIIGAVTLGNADPAIRGKGSGLIVISIVGMIVWLALLR